MMDHMVDQDNHCYYWPFNAVHQLDELDSYFGEMCVGGQSQSDSDGGFSAAPKNIVSERNRRKKLNETLYALRSAVPNITKMDKASIIKDAIEYIESMHAEEKRIQAEISEMEWGGASMAMDHHNDSTAFSAQTSNCYDYSSASTSTTTTNSFAVESSHHPIQLLELRVSSMAEKIIMVSLSCSKGRDTMVKLCDIFESLDLKIISANITSLSGRLLNTLFLEGDDNEKEALSFKIKAAIAALNDPDSPNCI